MQHSLLFFCAKKTCPLATCYWWLPICCYSQTYVAHTNCSSTTCAWSGAKLVLENLRGLTNFLVHGHGGSCSSHLTCRSIDCRNWLWALCVWARFHMSPARHEVSMDFHDACFPKLFNKSLWFMEIFPTTTTCSPAAHKDVHLVMHVKPWQNPTRTA